MGTIITDPHVGGGTIQEMKKKLVLSDHSAFPPGTIVLENLKFQNEVSGFHNGGHTFLVKNEQLTDLLKIPSTHGLILNVGSASRHYDYRRTADDTIRNSFLGNSSAWLRVANKGNTGIHGTVVVAYHSEIKIHDILMYDSTIRNYHDSVTNIVILLKNGVQLIPLFTSINYLEDWNGLRVNPDLTFNVFDKNYKINKPESLILTDNYGYNRRRTDDQLPNFTVTEYDGLRRMFDIPENLKNYSIAILANEEKYLAPLKYVGISKLAKMIRPFYEIIAKSNPYLAAIYNTFIIESGKSVSSVKVSVIYNETFKDVKSAEDLKTVLEMIRDKVGPLGSIPKNSYYQHSNIEKLAANLPVFLEKRKAVVKTKAKGAFNKLTESTDQIGVDPNKYPLTHSAIMEGRIPTGTFFRKSETYFIINDNWELWEEMLRKYPEVTIEIATEASKRTTYEKNIMSYFYFVLRKLPEYLEKHTGKKWTGIPKLVKSTAELEPPKSDGDRGVSKKRSALTPIVDNAACTIVVPYASLRVPGVQTTYTYSLNYNVIEDGLSIDGNVCTRDLEPQLNGRDDFGLMFYTLTGSAVGRGYPSFLIIFERLDSEVKVHFHRVHPMRSKQGDISPVNQWTRNAFKWMIGNIPFDKIRVQQGDLAFVEKDMNFDKEFESTEGAKMVTDYDSHAFEIPVKFIPYVKKEKKNVLGYVKIEQGTSLIHPEHRDRFIPTGVYEIRQARSWEANPTGIWSLRID